MAVQRSLLSLLYNKPPVPALSSLPLLRFSTSTCHLSKNESKKKATVIKKLYKENKEIFGELLESKREKVKRVKKLNKLTKAKNKIKGSTATFTATEYADLEATLTETDIDNKPNEFMETVARNNQPKDMSVAKAEINWNLKNFPQRTKIIERANPEVVIETFGPPKVQVLEKSDKRNMPEMTAKEMRQLPTLKQFLASFELQDIKPSITKVITKRKPNQIETNDNDNDKDDSSVARLPLTEDESEFDIEDSFKSINVNNNDERNELKQQDIIANSAEIAPGYVYTFTDSASSTEQEETEQISTTSSGSTAIAQLVNDIPSSINSISFDNQARKTSNSLIENFSPLDIISLQYEYNNDSKPSNRLPSVSKILQATMSEEQVKILERWQQKMIEQLGEAGFKQYKAALFQNGKELHRNIQSVLSGTPREVLSIDDAIFGHWNSLQNILPKVESVKVLESLVTHPTLDYCGIVDCVAVYRDKLVLIDWKTSEKRKPFVSMTYDTPLQIAAYIGALNHDPNYSFQVCEGLIVIAYQDGSPGQQFHLNSNELKKYWEQWMQRLQLFKGKQEVSSMTTTKEA